MKIKRLVMGGLLSLAMAVTFIPNDVLAAPQEGGGTPEAVTLQTEEVTIQPEVDLAEPDELLQDYLQKHAKQQLAAKNKKPSKRKAPRSSCLESDADNALYEMIADMAVEIAAGEREEAVLTEYLSEVFEPMTAEELGLETLTDETGNLTDEAEEAYLDATYGAINNDAIVGALLADMPYEMYWYDKTKGVRTNISYAITLGDDGETVEFYDQSIITYKLTVSNEFRPDGESDGYTVDTEKTSTASNAATVAADVVSDYEGETDLNKLIGYKDTICEYTDYNHPAADDDDTPYGNPWQLIWVFDNDPDTTVVCEGYSKAFQLLCDLSTFEDEDIESHIVYGEMDGGTGAGAHMWNIVHMDNSKNYLVDVTNSDNNDEEQSIGYPDWLFLKGYARIDSDDSGDKYVFLCEEDPDPDDPAEVTYRYDNKILDLYRADELELSDTDYQELTEEEKNQKAADRVTDLIEQVIELGEINEDNAEEAEELIFDASEAYDALTDEQKALVDPALYVQLQKAQAELASVMAGLEAVYNVIDLIDALAEIEGPEDITDEISAQISAAREAYDLLSEEQQEKVTNYDILLNAELQQSLAGSTVLELDVAQDVNIRTAGEEAIFTFTPEHDGTYLFTSSGDEDTRAEAYNEEGEQIAYDDDSGEGRNFLLTLADAEAGHTYTLCCRFFSSDKTGTFSVLLTESDVRQITYTFAESHTLVENVGGNWETDGNENDYFRYYLPGCQKDDILTVTDKDGNSETYTYTNDGEDEMAFVSDSGKTIDPSMVRFDSEQYEQHWGVGSNNEVVVSYLGIRTTAMITIEPNPVTGISFSRDGEAEVNLVENRDGELTEEYNNETEEYESYFKYNLPFREGDTLVLEGDGGPCGTYIWVDSKGGFYLKDHPVIGKYVIGITSDQAPESPWTKDDGEDHQLTLSYYGQSCVVSARIVANPIAEIEYTGDPIVLTEGVNAQWIGEDEDDPDGYYMYEIDSLNLRENASFTIKGDESVAGEYVYDEYEDSFVCEELMMKIDRGDIKPVDGVQDETHWIVGDDNESVWSYQGIRFTIPVTIQENDIESIEFTPVEDAVYLFEQENQKTYVSRVRSELWDIEGHELTLNKKGGSSVTYVFQEVDEDKDLEYSMYFVSTEDEDDMISFDSLDFRTDDDVWAAEDDANLIVGYMGKEASFQVPVRKPIVRIEYVPAEDYKVYEGVGEEDEDGFWYELETELAGDQLELYDSDDENAEPAFTFISQGRVDGEGEWETEDGLSLYRLGYLSIDSNMPWTGSGPWVMNAVFHMDRADYDSETKKFTDEIPVELSDENPVAAVSYTQSSTEPVTLYQGIDDAIGETGFSGYTAITEGDTVTITDAQGGTKTYEAVWDQDDEGMDFVNQEDEEDVLNWTFIRIDPVEGEDGWTPGPHEFTFSYYGVSSEEPIRVNICESPVSNVKFTPKAPIKWDAEQTGHEDEDENGNTITVYERYYQDIGHDVFHDGDTLSFTWQGTENRTYTYTVDQWDEGEFVDTEGKAIDVPYWYEDDQRKGDPWKIGDNKGYINVGGVRSEAFTITIECAHRLLAHTGRVEASCTDAGHEEYWTCLLCDTMFADQNHEHVIDAPVSIAPSHDWGEWKPLDDTWHQRTCNACSATEQEAHEWGEWTVVTAPTDHSTGLRTCECTVCGKEKSEVIPETTHAHILVNTPAKAATCEAEGNSAYWTCSECGKYFSDSEGKTEIDEGDWIIPKKAHTMTATPAKAATCEAAGNSAYWYCSECKKYYSDADGETAIEEGSWIIPKKAHTMTATPAKAATCEAEGNSAYWYCSECKKYYSDADGETAIEEGSWVIQKKPHTMTATPAKAATCEAEGNSAYWYCSKCKKYYSDEEGTEAIAEGSWIIPKKAHTMTATPAKAATCEAEGNSAYWYCSKCKKYYSDEEGTEAIAEGSRIIQKKPHTMTATAAKAATCTAEGNSAYWYCSECKKYYSDEEGTEAIAEGSWIIQKKPHTMTATAAKAATCTENGNSAYWYCSECEKYYSDADGKNEISENSWIISKKGHSMQHVAAAEPTRTKSGNYEYWYCEKCKKYFKDAEGTQEYEGDAWKISPTGSEEVVAAVTAAETLVGEAEKINADTYSANSYAAVKAALEALQKVLADDSSTADQITTATQNLQKAIDGLKMNQTLNVKTAKKTVKVKKLKKKAQSVKPLKVTGQKTTVTYKGKPVGKKAKKALKINAKTGKITVKKKTKKGTYKMKVTVTAAASAKYEKAVKTVTVTIKVK